jgi:predicted enzyme related to lactoylglutathione lyase
MSTVARAVGKFVWHEQVSSDPKQAQAFYTDLFGWGAEAFGGSDYTMISSGGAAHGGYGQAMEGAPPPHWLNHVQVDDVDATVERAKQAGGSLAAGPFDMPDVGRMAIVGDPQGAYVGVYRPAGEWSAPEGVFVWCELGTTDADAAQRFYEAVFGWTTKDMGAEYGGYRIFHRSDDEPNGVAGLMANPSPEIPAYWTPYVGVADPDATAAKAKELGATVVVEPMDIPNVGRFAIIRDPQGATFGIIRGEPTE